MANGATSNTYILDKRRLRQAFENAATTYDSVAVLQREMADRLLARLDLIKLSPQTIIDVGCGTGYCTRAISKHYPRARTLGLDIAPAMVARAQKNSGAWNRLRRKCLFIGGDAECLPVLPASIDMLVSSATLQWCAPPAVFAEAKRVLRPGGLLMFATFGPDTLHELRAAWRTVDDSPHVHNFIDMHDLGDMLIHAGFADPVMDMERITLTYNDVMGVLRDLKRLGAHNAANARTRGLTGKSRFAQFCKSYEAIAQNGRIPATFEVVYGHAWAPELASVHVDGNVVIPIADIGRRIK